MVRHINEVLYKIPITVQLMRLRICITLRIPTIIRVVQNTMTDTMIVSILLQGGGIGLMILVLIRLLQLMITILTIVRCIPIQNTPIRLHVA